MNALQRIARHAKTFIGDLRSGNFKQSDGGILVRDAHFGLQYAHGVNGGDWVVEHNLVPDAAILDILNVYFGATAKHSAWYIAPFSGSSSPAAGWTAANFTSNATEITSTTEGFSETTRQQANFGSAATGAITNFSSVASFTIVTATTVSITGLGLLTVNTRGGTTGLLGSAFKFAVARSLANADTFQAKYSVALSD